MDQNEMMNQLANNPQMLAQLLQIMQQNGMNQPNQKPPANWNMPTSPITNMPPNPMMALWLNNMMNSMNNQGDKSIAQNNNQAQQQGTQNDQKPEDTILSVRVVNSPDDIKVDQIQMNGKISLFIQNDMSVIYGKRWKNDGTIDTLRFVLDSSSEPNSTETLNNTVNNNQNFSIEELMAAVTNVIDDKLDKFKKEYPSNNYNQSKGRNNRKGGEIDGK